MAQGQHIQCLDTAGPPRPTVQDTLTLLRPSRVAGLQATPKGVVPAFSEAEVEQQIPFLGRQLGRSLSTGPVGFFFFFF